MFSYRDAGKIIWSKYFYLKKGFGTVIRSGFGLYGIYKLPETFYDEGRSESDAEHTLGTLILLRLISEFQPEVLEKLNYRELNDVLLLHEIGEIELGDIPDDGSRNEDFKNQTEYRVAESFVKVFGNRRRIMHIFKNFQKRARRTGELLYMIDKAEAILQGLIYEKQGRGGHLFKKPAEVTERDRLSYEATGRDDLVDIWAYGFVKRSRKFRFYEQIFSIIEEAVIDVRGKSFDWIDKV